MANPITLVLVVDGPPRLAARVVAEHYHRVRVAADALHVRLDPGETPEGVLAYCRERQIGVRASCVLTRVGPHRAEVVDAPPTSAPWGATRDQSSQEVLQ